MDFSFWVNYINQFRYLIVCTDEKGQKRGQRKFLPCIHGLDNLFHEDPQGNSILVEGRAGGGKTILCLQIAYEQAKKEKSPDYEF